MPEANPHHEAKRIHEALRMLFGGLQKRTIMWIAAFWVSVSLFSSGLYEMSQGRFLWAEMWMLLLPILLVLLYYEARKVSEDIAIAAEKYRPFRSLILFLSPPGDLRELDSLEGDLSERSLRDRIPGPWRMAAEAIARHLERLEVIVVLPTKDSPGQPGTAKYFDEFARTVKRLSPSRSFRFVPLAETNPAWSDGVVFNDAGQWLRALQDVYVWLHKERFRDRDIMVDITGGPKVATVAGVVVTLGEQRFFQYVNTLDYEVLPFSME